jgi:histone-arginine methyltransferase CARM1
VYDFVHILSDKALYDEQAAKTTFWNNTDFYGIDISSIVPTAHKENFSQAIVGNFSSESLLTFSRTVHCIDFSTVTCEELKNFEIPFSFRIDKIGIMHGFGGWFDLMFLGSSAHVELSTSPDHPGTHWYQCRLLLSEPIAVNRGQVVSGKMVFTANKKFSYDIDITARLEGTDIVSTNTVYLHDQAYNYLQEQTGF